MLVAGFPAGPWGTNCYVVAASEGSECVIIDPGKDAVEGVRDLVVESRLRPVAVLLTHGHIDHMWSVLPVADGYAIPALVHPADRALLSDPLSGISTDSRAMLRQMTGGLAEFVEPSEVIEVSDGLALDIAGLGFVVDHAPGHTAGSVTYRRDTVGGYAPVMFSGDVLFAGSIGRTDLPGGDTDEMMRSLARVVLPLPDDTVVLPGHGEQTTIGRERSSNPYLRALLDDASPPADQRRGL